MPQAALASGECSAGYPDAQRLTAPDSSGGATLVPVVTGFVAHDASGRVTTLGRGGSDLTAAVLGAAEAIGLLQPPGVAVDFIVAACENMVRHRGCLCAALAKSLALVRNLLSVLFSPFLSLPFDSQLSIYLSVSRPLSWH